MKLSNEYSIKRVQAGVLVLFFLFGVSCSGSKPACNSPKSDDSCFNKDPWLLFDGNPLSMTLLWESSIPMPASISFGTSEDNMNKTVTLPPSSDEGFFKYKITGLKRATRYYYKVEMGDEVKSGSFNTAPGDDAADVDFFVYGDTRTGVEFHNKICADMNEYIDKNPSFQTLALHVGDFVTYGSRESSWSKEWFSTDAADVHKFMADVPLLSCVGNHEESGNLFDKYFPYPFVAKDGRYWSFDYGPAHIVFLDQYSDYSENSPQHAWLEKELSTTDKKWKFLVFHEPGWSAGGYHKDNMDVRTNIQPLLVKYDVAAVFTGHNHYYARAEVEGVMHITTGGGGAPLYDPEMINKELKVIKKAYHFCTVSINGNTLNFKAIDIDNKIIDSFTVSK